MLSNNKMIDLGFPFKSLEEAREVVQPDQVIIKDRNNIYFIVQRDIFMEGPFQLGYEII